jgi:hypothetical protein
MGIGLACGAALAALLCLQFTGCFSDKSPPAAEGGVLDGASSASAGDAGPPPLVAPTDAAATVVIDLDSGSPASPLAYGQNYWSWVSAYGDQVDQVQDGAAAMKLGLLRAGGHNNDNNAPEAFSNDHIDRFVAYARAAGAEPLLQVPLLLDGDGGRPSPASAAAMVTYANVTQGYGIKYWEIGNEPDLYSDQGDLPAGYTAASYCADFSAFADAMRAADPTIEILGPELSYKYVPGNDWLTPFLQGCGSKVDVVSVHRYPFAASACSIANAVGDGVQFRSTVRRLRALLDSLGLTSTPLAVTEANFSYQGDPTLQTGAAALGTFYAGLWVADVAGIALEENLWSLSFWSLDEGFTTGFFTSDTFQPRPAAYAYELLSTHFGAEILHPAGVPTGLSVYASRDAAGGKTAVLLINRTASAASPILEFRGFVTALPNLAATLPGYSLTLVEVHDDRSQPAVWLYTKSQSDDGVGPVAQ